MTDTTVAADAGAADGPTSRRGTALPVTPAPAGPVPVGCACCGRLATAAAHLHRPAPAAPGEPLDRVVSTYRRNAEPGDRPTGRSVLG